MLVLRGAIYQPGGDAQSKSASVVMPLRGLTGESARQRDQAAGRGFPGWRGRSRPLSVGAVAVRWLTAASIYLNPAGELKVGAEHGAW